MFVETDRLVTTLLEDNEPSSGFGPGSDAVPTSKDVPKFEGGGDGGKARLDGQPEVYTVATLGDRGAS